MVAVTLVSVCQDIASTVVVTRIESVISNHEIENGHLESCLKEEADNRMFLHAKEVSRLGFKRLVVSVDIDVIIIALYSFWFLDFEELWIEFGCGKNRKWIPIHLYSKALGEEICMALPFWYAFTGCDTVSQFAGRGKKTAWKAWTSFPRVTETFARLSSARELSASDLVTLE